jgi:biotin synthase-related radical SAM superfamily protein
LEIRYILYQKGFNKTAIFERLVTVEKIRISIGSASILGLYETKKFKDKPTTCYLMTHTIGHCSANCGFCPQARESGSSIELLSRVSWPVFSFKDFLTKLNYMPQSKRFKRICIQTLNYLQNFQDLLEIVSQIRKTSNIPISIAIPPMGKENLERLKLLGVDRIGIALDGASPEIFEQIKGKIVNGPYNWDSHIQNLKVALTIFGEGNVTTHIIVGLGETAFDIMKTIKKLHDLRIKVSLFAFMPIKGTKLENLSQPDLRNFRKIQLGRYLLVSDNRTLKDFTFNDVGEIVKFNLNEKELLNIICNTDAFLTSGCPGCNRPYYTSRPSGPIYNYPRTLVTHEMDDIFRSLSETVQ